jgi:hypothetical protein
MAGLEMASPATPGWYADPGGRARWRYWDGSAWTPWIDRGDTSVPDPLGVPEADPPAAGTAVRGLQLRAVEPHPPAPADVWPDAGSPPGSRYQAALWLALAGAVAVVVGVVLFSTSRPSTAVWDIPPGQGYGALAVIAGLVQLVLAFVVWLVKFADRPSRSDVNNRAR